MARKGGRADRLNAMGLDVPDVILRTDRHGLVLAPRGPNIGELVVRLRQRTDRLGWLDEGGWKEPD